MNKKRILKLLLSAGVIAALFAGCGTDREQNETASVIQESDTAQTAAAESKAAEVTQSPGTTTQSGESDKALQSMAAQQVAYDSREFFAMDTYMTIACYGERSKEALDAAEEEILRLDALLSIGNPDSEIRQLNENGSGTVSEDTMAIILQSLELYETTDGAFDITVYPLMELWGFTSQDFSVPEPDAIEQTLQSVGSGTITAEQETGQITLGEGQGIDLGGIAKGYASGRLAEIFKEYDIVGAVASLGGNVQCYGTKTDGSTWRCGIRDPFHSSQLSAVIGVLETEECAVVTSGAYERSFTGEDGKLYHHILDPHTGYPAETGLASVSIVSKSGMLSDGLSTACYVMGLERAAEYWRTSEESFDMILITEDREIYITAPLKEKFSSSVKVHIIE